MNEMKRQWTVLTALCCTMFLCASCDEDDTIIPQSETFSVGQVHWVSEVTPTQREVISNLIENMVKVEGCDFYMGAQIRSVKYPNYCSAFSKTDTLNWVGPVLQVTMPDYYIGRYEVTQAEWMAVMDTLPTGNYCKVDTLKGRTAWYAQTGLGDRVAAYNVSFDDACRFVQTLSAKTGLAFRLPTEAEWECAARGGRYTLGYKYSGSDTWSDVAWCYTNAQAPGLGSANYGVHEVGQLPANELGIYDMSGNVSEWVANSYYRYSLEEVINPQGRYGGDTLILRGGSWVQKNAIDFSVANRKKFIQSSYIREDGSRSESFYDAIANTGFRIALSR
jgi:formylglycine-generating enzyme required for sulfatase activity